MKVLLLDIIYGSLILGFNFRARVLKWADARCVKWDRDLLSHCTVRPLYSTGLYGRN